jgi:hypothetical protein
MMRQYLAQIGAKGGSAGGPAKARSPEHYQLMVKRRIAANRRRAKPS